MNKLKYGIYGKELFNSEIYLPIKKYLLNYQEEKKEIADLSLKAFREFFSRLHDRLIRLIEIEIELVNYADRQSNKTTAKPLAQIQMDFVDKTEAFHQQIYSTLSSFVKLLSVITPHGFIMQKHIKSNQNFIKYIRELIKFNDILPVEKSLIYRGTYIDHTSQIRHFDWMTFFWGEMGYVIYYEPDENGCCEEISTYIDMGKMKIPISINLPVKVKNFLVTPNHLLVYIAFYEFIIELLRYLRINNNIKTS